MNTLSQITYLTLIGLSLLFVGGFVLWVYGERSAIKPPSNTHDSAAEIVLSSHTQLAQWFLLYGAATSFTGVGCLLTAAAMTL